MLAAVRDVLQRRPPARMLQQGRDTGDGLVFAFALFGGEILSGECGVVVEDVPLVEVELSIVGTSYSSPSIMNPVSAATRTVFFK